MKTSCQAAERPEQSSQGLHTDAAILHCKTGARRAGWQSQGG